MKSTIVLIPFLAMAGVVSAQPIQLTAKAEVVTSESKSSIVVKGRALGAPDGTMLHAHLRLFDKVGLEDYAQVSNQSFTFTFGPAPRLLPGSYSIQIMLDPRVQKRSVEDALRGRRVAPTTEKLEVGEADAAKAERAQVLKALAWFLEAMHQIHDKLLHEGGLVVLQSARQRIRFAGGVPREEQLQTTEYWRQYTEGVYRRDMTAIRRDLAIYLQGYLVHYFPAADPVLNEILMTLDKAHAAYEVAMATNLGIKKAVHPQTVALAAPALKPHLRKLLTLAKRAYGLLDLGAIPWGPMDLSKPEKASDAKGDVFRSSLSKFEVRKPSDWMFEMGSPKKRQRIRMRPRTKSVETLSGVEISPHPGASSFEHLARLHEAAFKKRWEENDFELISSKPLQAKDPTMPNGVRPGAELHYRLTRGKEKKKYHVFHYALFGRWNKRAFNLICLVDEVIQKETLPTFEGIARSFKVLDEPEKGDR